VKWHGGTAKPIGIGIGRSIGNRLRDRYLQYKDPMVDCDSATYSDLFDPKGFALKQ